MTKISKKEYEELKALDDGWKWIARDGSGELYIHGEKPKKIAVEWVNEKKYYLYLGNETFQFIQWEDEEPCGIAELIEEYEIEQYIKESVELGEQAMRDHARKKVRKESEETEMKSKQELIEKWESAIESAEFYGKGKEERLIGYIKEFVSDLKQLEEPKITEEQAWEVIHGKYGNETLQNNIDYVESQGYVVIEKPVIPQFVADWFEESKEHFDSKLKSVIKYPPQYNEDVTDFTKWVSNPVNKPIQTLGNMFNGYEVEEEQKYYVLNSEGETMIRKNDSGIRTSSGFKIRSGFEGENYKLTEQEIKEYDDRFWPFAIKVEELEDD